MRRFVLVALIISSLAGQAHEAQAVEKVKEGQTVVVTSLTFEIWRKPDGKKYPMPLQEHYQVQRDGAIVYSGYFGDVPMEFPHNDGVTWPSGTVATKFLGLVQRLARDPKSGLKYFADGSEPPSDFGGKLQVGVRLGDADQTYGLAPGPCAARKQLEPALIAVIAAFEKGTGRPLTPAKLR